MKKILILFFNFIFLNCLNNQLNETNLNITLRVEERSGWRKVGKIGTVVLSTLYYGPEIFDDIDIEEKTKFETIVEDIHNNNIYKIYCRLRNSKLKTILCSVEEAIPSGEYYVRFNNTKFNYKGYEVIVNGNDNYYFEKLDKYLIDLYADEQTINVEEGKNFYEIKFKIHSYNQERLFLVKQGGIFYLENCNKNKNELICIISKERLEEIMEKNNEKFFYAFNNGGDSEDSGELQVSSYLYVNYKYPKKEDIYVKITKLLSKCAQRETTIAYATNITNISKITPSLESFKLSFNELGKKYCSFRKTDGTPLLIICKMDFGNNKFNNSLSEIKEEIILDNINIKYNFRIQPVKNIEKFYACTSSGSLNMWSYPKVLDFTMHDNITIEYFMGSPSCLNGIRLNKDAPDLECENIKGFKRCIVHKSHFKGKENGYYYTMYRNCLDLLDSTSIFYELPPTKVILTKVD